VFILRFEVKAIRSSEMLATSDLPLGQRSGNT
jgi:hypothetical protein